MKEELFGGWGIDWEIFQWIISHLPKGSTILELGSGKASAELNRYYNLYSVEHAQHYIGMYETNYIYASYPDTPPNEKSWYGNFDMPKYDLLLIDGPDHSLRKNILDRMELFDWSKPVIIDDVHESDILLLAEKIQSSYCQRQFEIIKGGDKQVIKSFMVIP